MMNAHKENRFGFKDLSPLLKRSLQPVYVTKSFSMVTTAFVGSMKIVEV
jgi:hypothetical protein